jgi:carbon-monoxide dehydrogenase medium subunit
MRFERYIRARSVEECVDALRRAGAGARILAGGTDLIPRMNQRSLRPNVVVDIGGIPGLAGIQACAGGFLLGAMTRLRVLQTDDSLDAGLSILRVCAGHVSSMQVRNVATIGGNCCNASPAADTVPALLLLEAEVCIEGAAGKRRTPVRAFLKGPGKTDLRGDEVVTGFFLPKASRRAGTAYCKYAIRGDSDISIVGAGAYLERDSGGRISQARVALASAGPTALRVEAAERMLAGEAPTDEALAAAADLCARVCAPIGDQRASGAYRRDMVRVFVQEALQQAAARAAH